MKRHAYLILAHKFDYVFCSLLKMIDDERNDIFIHMDKKNRTYKESETREIVKKSRVYHCKPRRCTWGAFSIVKAELSLLHLSTSTSKYSYYHLLSGQDLPIQSQDTIHKFFASNSGKEFIGFDSLEFDFHDRVRVYNVFQEFVGRRYSRINDYFLTVQKLVGINRNKRVKYQKGHQWFSISDEFARYLLSKERWIRELFRFTFCPDESFVQTVLVNSPFIENQFLSGSGDSCTMVMRHIDWKRGTPYTFRKEDFGELDGAQEMFARKFDENVDKFIIDMIVERYGA